MNRVITISRQFGSGGRTIGRLVGEKLGIPCYDQELLEQLAEKSGFAKEYIKERGEYTERGGWLANALSGRIGGGMNNQDYLWIAQRELILELAAQGSCVIVGRCADYVLRDESNILRVFVFGDLDHRKERVMQRHPDVTSAQVVDIINKTDKRRSSYYNFYTGQKWGKFDNYDLTVNSSTLGIDGVVNSIVDIAKKMMD